ncbi:MAG TPA: S53 family peptidase [Thermoplasmata archaeon]|nr:S53 family peptidase [Thermoplasmata archaeon]
MWVGVDRPHMHVRWAKPPIAASLALLMVLSGWAAIPAAPIATGDRSHFELRISTLGSEPAFLPASYGESWAVRSGFNATDLNLLSTSSPAVGTVSVELTLWPSDPAMFTARAAGAPSMSTAQIADAYGVSPSEYQGLIAYFESFGLSVAQGSPIRLSLLLDGSASSVGAAFNTQLRQAEVAGHSVQFPTSIPRLPTSLEALVEAVSGLSSGSVQFTIPFVQSAPARARGAAGSPSAITPNDIHVMYGLDGLYNYSGSAHWASNQGIAVVLWGSGYNPGDLSTFFSQEYPSEFPPAKWAAYPVNGAPSPSPNAVNDPSNSTQELTLDIEWSASEAPGATIDAVYAKDGPASDGYSPTDADMEAAINEAVNNIPGVRVISMSFGSLDGGDPSFEAALSQDFAVADQRSITVLAASGDNGGTTKGQPGCGGGPAPQFPAASPWVIAVGGTAPVLQQGPFGTVTGIASEPAWDDSGGGYSTSLAAPTWQNVGSAGQMIQANGGHRGIPDVAGPAARNLFYYNGMLDYGSGTSFGTPMWAGLIAEMNAIRGAPLGFITDRLYQIAATQGGSGSDGLVDVSAGSTCLTTATAGWDAATGWGSPRAEPLYEHIAGTFVDVTLNASATSVAPGGSLTIAVGVTNATSHRAIGSLPVSFAMTGSFPGPCTGTLASSSNASTDSTGSANVTMTVPSCYLGSTVAISATVDSGGYLGGASTSVGINLLGLAGLIALSETFPYNVLLFALIMAVAIGIGLWIGGRRKPSGPPARSPPAAPAGAVAGTTIRPPPPPAAPRGPGTSAVVPAHPSPAPPPTVLPTPNEPPPVASDASVVGTPITATATAAASPELPSRPSTVSPRRRPAAKKSAEPGAGGGSSPP